jgi:stringent starvation protein B
MSDTDTTSSITPSGSSTRPYLVRAMYEWCTDNGFTPYIAAYVDGSVQVPREFVKDNEIVLNVGMEATSDLHLGNDYVTFKARFSGIAREIMVPMERVMAIYARENGQGMTFPVSPNTPVTALAPNPMAVPSSDESPASSTDSNVVQLIKPKAAVVSLAKVVEDTVEDAMENGQENATQTTDEPPEPPKSPSPARGGLKRVK